MARVSPPPPVLVTAVARRMSLKDLATALASVSSPLSVLVTAVAGISQMLKGAPGGLRGRVPPSCVGDVPSVCTSSFVSTACVYV